MTEIVQWPTVFQFGKAIVGVGYSDCAGDAAGVGERGMPGNGWVVELGKAFGLSHDE